MMDIDKSEFLSNLRLTQAYCERQIQAGIIDPLVTLRSVASFCGEGKVFKYRPNEFATLGGKTPGILVEWSPNNDPYENEFFSTLFAEQLAYKLELGDPIQEEEYAGKILVLEYDLDIADGASAVESEGFVDTIDFPPIDTWFYRLYTEDNGWVLFAWIPQQFVKFADEAIAVHFLNIIRWLEDWAPAEFKSVMELGNL